MKHRVMRVRACVLAVLLTALLPASARAIDCSRTPTPLVSLVCEAPSIRVLNDDLKRLLGKLDATLDRDGREALPIVQRDWEASLKDCMNSSAEAASAQCLRDRFREQIKLLSGRSVDGPGPEPRMQPLPVKVKPIEGNPYIGVLLLRFARPASPGELAFNAIADRLAREARAGTLDAGQQGTLLLGFSMSAVSDRLISAHYGFGYTCGGCGDESDLEVNYNIDVRTGKLIDIPSLFPAGNLLRLAVNCLGQVIRARGLRLQEWSEAPDATVKRDMRDVLAEGEFDSMSYAMSTEFLDQTNWSISANDAKITFGVNTMGSYIEGPYECSLPMYLVRHMALPDAPLP